MYDEYGNLIDGTIDWNAEYGADESSLDPFNETMANAVNATGATSTPVTAKTSGLAELFHSLVVAPSGNVQTGSTVGNILNYFSQSLVQKPTTPAQYQTQQGVSRVIYGSGNTGSAMSNPLVWIGILVAIVLVVILVKKFA